MSYRMFESDDLSNSMTSSIFAHGVNVIEWGLGLGVLVGFGILLASGCGPAPPADVDRTDSAGTRGDASSASRDTGRVDAGYDAGSGTVDSGGDAGVHDSGRVEAGADGGETGGSQMVEFRVTSPRSDRLLRYELEVVVRPEMIRDGSRFEAEPGNDEITEGDEHWTIQGQTGTAADADKVHGDSYRWEAVDEPEYGIAGWSVDAAPEDYTLTINGREVDPGALPSIETQKDETGDGPCLGGGSCYDSKVTADQADVTVGASADVGDLESALSKASGGEVVFIDGEAEIDLGDGGITIPDGVTLASDRGVDGAAGALLFTEQEAGECLALEGESRLTGIRLKGPHPGGDTSGSSDAGGAETLGAGEIDNCEVWGFAHHGIQADSGDGAHIHHNVIRDNNKSGLGYGVAVASGNPVIEYNYFNFNRHGVATGGSNPGYVCRYNHFGPELTDTRIDAHEPAGVRYEIHNNVVEGVVADIGRFEGERRPAVQMRGVPDEVAEIDDNWFWNPRKPEPGTWSAHAIIQPHSDDWENVTFSGNAYGEEAGVSFSDVIPGYDGWRSQ